MLKIEADETQCLTRVLSVTNSASASTTGLVIKNTATTGTARLQLDANTGTGFAQLEVAPAGNCTLNVPGQEIWLQNRLTGQAPLIVETNSIVTTAYGQNDLSDEKVKQNIRDADLDELQAIFDRAAPKRYTIGPTSTRRTDWAFWPRTCSTEALPERRCGAARSF